MIRYWCTKCKVDIIESCVTSSVKSPGELTHQIVWKDGQRWHHTFHKVVKIIERDKNVDSD